MNKLKIAEKSRVNKHKRELETASLLESLRISAPIVSVSPAQLATPKSPRPASSKPQSPYKTPSTPMYSGTAASLSESSQPYKYMLRSYYSPQRTEKATLKSEIHLSS
jgi:hypothetical protein